jgi:RimJ/RimL family protein N-acetyltransferase
MTKTVLHEGELLLRPVSDDDAPAIFAACRDGDMARLVPRFPDPYTEEDAVSFAAHARTRWRDDVAYTFAITVAESGELLGVIELPAPKDDATYVGYWVKREARGRGVATRALRRVAHWAIEDLGVERLWLTTHPANVASQRVAEKAGFQREGVLRSHVRFRDGRRDSVIFSLLRSDLE